MAKLERLEKKIIFLVQFAVKLQAVIPFFASLARVGCTRNIIALEVSWSRVMNFNAKFVKVKE